MTSGNNPGSMSISAMVSYGIITMLTYDVSGPFAATLVGVAGMVALVPVIMLLNRAEEREELSRIKLRKAAEQARCRGKRIGQAH